MAKSPKAKPKPKDEALTDNQIAMRRDEWLGNLLRTPPKPHDEIVGKPKPKGKPKRKKKTPDK